LQDEFVKFFDRIKEIWRYKVNFGVLSKNAYSGMINYATLLRITLENYSI